jgi:hypothetical protein
VLVKGMLAGDDLRAPKRSLNVGPPVEQTARPRMKAGGRGGGETGDPARAGVGGPRGGGDPLNTRTETAGGKTAMAGKLGAVGKPQRPAAAATRTDEETPAALVGEADVGEGDDEGDVGGGKDGGRGLGVGAEMASGPQAGDGERWEIVDRGPGGED